MFVEELTQFSAKVAATPLSRFVQEIEGYVPAVQSLHILSIALLMAAAAMLNLRLLGWMNPSLTVSNLAQRFRKPLWWGVTGLVITGLALLLAEPERALISRVFQLKMLMLVVAVALSLRLHKSMLTAGFAWDAPRAVPPTAKALALISLALWCSIIFAGRWIAYAQY